MSKFKTLEVLPIRPQQSYYRSSITYKNLEPRWKCHYDWIILL